jgi:capsular polysaccharide biosynthesis protein
VSIWANNYFHILLEHLPKLAAVEAWCARHQKSPPVLIVEPTLRPWAGDALAATVARDFDVVPTQPHPFAIKRLIVPGWPRRHGVARPEAIEFVRFRILSYFAQSQVPDWGSKFIYITRAREKDRRVDNEGAVVDALAPLGFTFVDPGTMTFEEQVVAFRHARLIVGPHGAAMTNALFARHGCRVIEMFGEYINPCIWGALHPIGHRWGVLPCKPEPGKNMSVDIDALKATIHMMMERT